jgi:hypothetical protein
MYCLCRLVLFYVMFVCKYVLYYCHRVSTQLQLNISYQGGLDSHNDVGCSIIYCDIFYQTLGDVVIKIYWTY